MPSRRPGPARTGVCRRRPCRRRPSCHAGHGEAAPSDHDDELVVGGRPRPAARCRAAASACAQRRDTGRQQARRPPALRPRPSTATLRRPGRGAAAAGRRRAQRRRRQRPAGVAWRAAPPPASPPRQRRRTSCSARCPRPTLAASASSRRRLPGSPGNSTRTTSMQVASKWHAHGAVEVCSASHSRVQPRHKQKLLLEYMLGIRRPLRFIYPNVCPAQIRIINGLMRPSWKRKAARFIG